MGDEDRLIELVDALNESEGEPRGHFTQERVLADLLGDKPEIRVVLAELGGQIVGYASFENSYSTEWAQRGCYMHDLYVEPAARRQGAARALVAAVAAAAKADGRTFLWWCSLPRNRGARAFYRALGAKPERIIAHALALDAFQRLAVAGAPLPPDRPVGDRAAP